MEVFVTIGLGLAAGSLALVAFGLDSLVEVFASLVVLWHLGDFGAAVSDARTRRALRLVAIAFAVLAVYLLVAGGRGLWTRSDPDSSPFGIAYLGVTAVVMFTLARWKRVVGTALGAEPFIAEASVTLLDGCLASAILLALAANTAFGWWWADPVAGAVVGLVAARAAITTWRDATRSALN